MAIPPSAYASERGAVLILGADCVGDTCVVGTYGSGAIVKLDEHKNTAYVLTARHVARAADDLYVLYDPISLPSDLSFGLENGVVPDELAAVLEERGHPRPTQVRSGIPFGGPQVADGDSLYLLTESWILTGSGRQYLALPQTEYLELYHLLPAAFARESGAALDVALLAVEEFPHFERQPVVYLAEPDSIGRGTKVTTIGCECGSNEGISQAQVQGTVVSRDSEFLHYRSLLVRAAYTGGPVFLGDHVVAMNVCDDRQVGLPIRARLASTFKELVDEWIGLPRMTADLTIDSPEGARDEVVSVDQDFVVRARARLDPEGPMLAPVGEVRLEPHDSFRTDDEPAATLALGEDVTWTLSSPARATGTLPIRVVTDDSALGLESIPLAEVGVATEEGVLLKCIVVEGPSDGSEVFVKDDFSVDISFDQSGHPLSDLVGTVTIDVARDQFGVLGGQYSQAIRTQGPIRWWLRPKSVCRQAPISLVVDLHTMDRNGKPVRVELPDTIRVNIEVSRKVQLHVGLGRIAPKGDTGVELEMGVKFRVANIMQRGMPLLLGVAFAGGIDGLSNEEIQSPETTGDALIIDHRRSAGANLTVGFGVAEVSLEVGYVQFSRGIHTDLEPEYTAHLRTESTGSLYVLPGVEVHFPNGFGLFAGARIFQDLGRTELFLQARGRSGE